MDHKLETSEDLAGQAARLPEVRAIRTMFTDINGELNNRLIEKYGQSVPSERLRRIQDLPLEFQKREDFDRSLEKDGGTLDDNRHGYVRENSDESPHVDVDQEVPSIILNGKHEKVHQLAAPEAKADLGTGLYEGMTEFFAEDGVPNTSEHGVEDQSIRPYQQEASLARGLTEVVGKEAVEAAYFRGETEALREKVDQSLGKGTLESFGAHAKEWDDLPPEGSGS